MAFETTQTIDTFLTVENPYTNGGMWSAGYGVRPPLMSHTPGNVHGTVEFAVNGMAYLREVFTADVIEAFGCTPGSGLGAALESQRVAFWLNNPADLTGYSFGHGGGISESYFFRLYTSSGFTGIGGAHSRDDHPNKLGLRITPSTVEGWGFYTGETPEWQLVTTSGDTTHRGTFYAALETEEQGGINEVGFSCFGATNVNRTQFFRWLHN